LLSLKVHLSIMLALQRITARCDGKPQRGMAGPLHFQPTALQITLQ
jgi:hypothetical protein